MSVATRTPATGTETSYGLLARFDTPEALLGACRAAYQAGYRQMDAYSPIPVDGAAEAMGKKKTRIPLLILLAGIAGGAGGFFMHWFSMVYDYPFNIGGRPFNSWPAFIPITFELTVLSAAVCGVFGMLLRNGLPRLHHPVFKAPGIERASLDKFFLCIEASDPKWDPERTGAFLRDVLHSHQVVEVPK